MSATLVVNELLAFLQQKLDVMDEVSAIQICKSSFSEDDISEAKKLLYGSLGKMDQMVSRRRDGTQKSLQDIISLLKVTDPDDVPTFVAEKLHKLPPVTFDHVDVTCLLKDIVSLKANMAQVMLKLEASEQTVGELRKEVAFLRLSPAVCRSPSCAAFVNTRRGACLDTSVASSFESAASPSAAAVSAVPAAQPAAAASPATTAPRISRPPVVPGPRPTTPPPTSATPEGVAAPAAPLTFATVVASIPPAGTQPPTKSERPNDDGFVVVQKKRTRRVTKNRCGTAATGSDAILRAEAPSTPVYLSRLHYTIQVKDVAEYIRKKTGVPLGVQRVKLLESHHHASFKAFVVRFPTYMLERVLKEDFWPKGVVFRRFRGRFPADTPGKAPGN